MKRARIALLVAAIFATQCGRHQPTSPTPPTDPPPGTRTATLIGAGDIGLCGSPAVAATGRLIESNTGDVFIAGDAAYPHATADNFRDCFTPFWGHARGRWHAVPGNHEYESPGAAPYFEYFGAAAGPPGLGYYRFILGEWLVLMLNSEVAAGVGSAQYAFARDILEGGRKFDCQMAIWHRPLFSSGPNGTWPAMRDLWELLDEHDVDVVVNGHEHFYERFSRQDVDGRQDSDSIRQFTVGTGGASLYSFVRQAPNSVARVSTHGIIRFTLRPDSYEWEFLDVSGAILDNGSTECH